MEQNDPVRNERNFITNGVKTAALVVILGTFAAIADQAFFVAPHRAASPVADSPPAAVVQPTSQAFAVPPHLRGTAGDVPEHVQAY